MAMEGLPEVVPPSDKVPGQLLLAAPILKQWRQYREEMGKRTSILGVSSARAIYRRRGASGGHPGQPGGCPARPLLGRTRDPSGSLVVAQLPSLDYSGVLCHADFYIFFMEFFGHFNQPENLKNKNSRKPGTVNWVH